MSRDSDPRRSRDAATGLPHDADTLAVRCQQQLRALDALPELQAQIIRLRLAERWELPRIASHVGLTEESVAAYFRMGLRRLRELIEQAGD